MATDIVGSLFGVNPQAYQQGQQTRAYNQDYQAVQLDPLQQANLALRQGGRGIGQIAGGLLGMEDPELAKASKIKQVASQADLTSPEGMVAFAKAIQPFAPAEAAQAIKRSEEMTTSAATVTQKTRESVKQVGQTPDGRQVYQQGDTQFILTGDGKKQPYYGGMSSKTPSTSLDVKMLDIAGGRRKTFIDENKPLIDQGASLAQALTLISADTPFSQAAFENTVVSAFGGDKQKSVKEIQRLVNTGSFDQRVENSLRKFATGKIGDATQEDQKNILEAVQGDLKRRYNTRRENTLKASRNVKELQGQEDYMAPTWEETVGGGAAQGKKAYTIGETFNSKTQGVLTVTKVDAAGQPIEARNSEGKIGTLKGMK
jgi:hypothetical protein